MELDIPSGDNAQQLRADLSGLYASLSSVLLRCGGLAQLEGERYDQLLLLCGLSPCTHASEERKLIGNVVIRWDKILQG